jgi:hypothetical protein
MFLRVEGRSYHLEGLQFYLPTFVHTWAIATDVWDT